MSQVDSRAPRLDSGPRTLLSLAGLLRTVPIRDSGPFVGLLAFTAGLGLAQPILLGSVVGAIVTTVSSGSYARLAWPLTALVAVLLSTAAAQAATAVSSVRLERAVDGAVRDRIRRAAGDEPTLFAVEDADFLADATAARHGVHGVRLGAAACDLARTVYQYVNVVLLSAVIAHASLLAAAVIAVAIVTTRVLSIRSGVRRSLPATASAVHYEAARYARDLALSAPAAKEVRLFGTSPWLAERMRERWTEFYRPVFAARRHHVWRFAALYGAFAAVYCGALGWVAHLELGGRLSLGACTAALSAAVAMLLTLAQTYTRYLTVGGSIRAYQRIADRTPASTAATGALPADAPASEIRFEDVSFTYPGTDKPVFDGLNLTLRVGQSVGLVGVNGAGKTTLVKLLCGLYPPSGGRILVDGVDLATVAPARWRAKTAVLFQDFVHYELPLADNVRYGSPARDLGEATLAEVIEDAGLSELAGRLPSSAPLSPAYSGGVDLSGGEWQRVGLARALYAVRGGARVLVLDEPTAAYDIRAEEELFGRFLDLTEGLTTLLISHRLSAVRRTHRILVVDGGVIAEDGTHEELMAADGVYAEMFRTQARGVRDGADQDADTETETADIEAVR